MAAEDSTGDGIIPTLAILDELHRHKNLALYRTWSGKLRKRGGQLVAISTAGESGTEFEQTREKIRQTATETVRTGAHIRATGPGLVLHEWAVPEKADVTDMVVVKAANPLKAITVETLTAKFATPTMTLPHWKRLTCNLATRGSDAAITEAEWHGAASDEAIPEGEPVWLGLDVAWKWDTTAAVPLWWKDDEHRLLGPAEILVPPRDGSALDPDLIERALVTVHARNPIHTIVMDTSRAEQLGQWAERELGCRVIDWPQGIPTQVEEYERFMGALREGWLKHTGDPGLTQHALNAVAHIGRMGDAMFDRPSQTRAASEQERRVIDALKAAAMVHSAAVWESQVPAEPKRVPLVRYA
jgi:phage terminase large subunit-like protein